MTSPTTNTTTAAAPSSASPTEAAQSPSALPPAALDLAAKLFDLARTGETATLSHYLSAGVPKNLTNASGDTLLMLASYHGNVETTKMLLEKGADPNVLNGRGQSVIAGAVFKGWEEVVRVLYEGGADPGLGMPNAVECAGMFKREDFLRLFGVELGEGRTIDVGGK